MSVTYESPKTAGDVSLMGLSTDNKPLDVPVNTLFLELDTGKVKYFDGTKWHKVGGDEPDWVTLYENDAVTLTFTAFEESAYYITEVEIDGELLADHLTRITVNTADDGEAIVVDTVELYDGVNVGTMGQDGDIAVAVQTVDDLSRLMLGVYMDKWYDQELETVTVSYKLEQMQ